MNRRDFLRSTAIVSAGLVLSKNRSLSAETAAPASWRTFEVTTHVEVPKSIGTTLIWLPAALIRDTPYQTILSNRFSAEGGTAEIVENKVDALGIVAAKFAAGVKPVLTLTIRVAKRYLLHRLRDVSWTRRTDSHANRPLVLPTFPQAQCT